MGRKKSAGTWRLGRSRTHQVGLAFVAVPRPHFPPLHYSGQFQAVVVVAGLFSVAARPQALHIVLRTLPPIGPGTLTCAAISYATCLRAHVNVLGLFGRAMPHAPSVGCAAHSGSSGWPAGFVARVCGWRLPPSNPNTLTFATVTHTTLSGSVCRCIWIAWPHRV